LVFALTEKLKDFITFGVILSSIWPAAANPIKTARVAAITVFEPAMRLLIENVSAPPPYSVVPGAVRRLIASRMEQPFHSPGSGQK
jgi:hypothetical protein